MMLRIIIKLIDTMGKIICHRTVKFRQKGEEGNGFKAVVYRDGIFTESQWNTYGTIGHTESWTDTSGTRNGCRIGDLFQVVGKATDTNNSHALTYRCTNSSGNLAGTCIAHQMVPAGTTGKAGRWYEYAGEYGVDLPASLTNTDSHGWWVKRGNNCFMLIAASGTTVQTSTVPSTAAGNSTWELMTGDTRKLFIGAAFFGAYAHFGSFIINADWMISQYGVLYDSSGNPTIINSSNYQSNFSGHLPYTYFNESNPNSNVSGSTNFCPAFAIDGKTGKAYFNDAYIKGEIEANSGIIGGFTISSNSITSNSNKIALHSDGHGQVGGGGISWDANGAFSITSAFVNAIFKALASGYFNTYNEGGSTFYSSNEMKIANGKIIWNGNASNVTSWIAEASEGGFIVHKALSGVVDDDTKVSVKDSEVKLERTFRAFDETDVSDFAITSTGGKSTKRFKFACTNSNGNTEYAFIELIGVYGDNSDSRARMYANDIYLDAESDVYVRGGNNNSNTYNGWIHINSSGDITASGTITTSSDERLKKIVKNVEATIEQIAKVRIVDYYFKADKKKKVALGSIAQDWQEVFPNAVRKDKEGHLSLDYSAAALASAVTAAKEIAKLKEENENLKRRLSAIEEKLGINK